ncbi:MAG: NADH:flavin oxidoreductase/NADH oxidase [Chloroflexi bacterium]|nr:MAG: NADH:flavin oxidoreductase/NADH oxidase [Chloroflexota bacterium]
MSALFEPFTLREVEARNRLWVSPMCQYSTKGDGVPTDWHLVHLGSRAVGGAGLVMTEATAVSADGRISLGDTGIWSDAQVEAFKPITRFITAHGAVPAIQLAHAGRKASTKRPWDGSGPLAEESGAWEPVGPSPVAYTEGYPTPRDLTTTDIRDVIDAFADGARRAVTAGFRAVEIHEAHGYLVAEFLSPYSNQRTDEYGGDLDGRTRLAVGIARAVRESVPAGIPIFVRVSASEYVQDGWDLDQTVALCTLLKAVGVDLIDASSGGNLPHQLVRPYPGYQVPFARAIRERVGIATGAVGLITAPAHAESIVAAGEADAVFVGREELRDPYFPLHAAAELGAEIDWPVQYQRARR